MINLIKTTFSTLFFIYKNIFHWVISKILILVSTFLMWVLVLLPFILLSILIIYLSPLTLSNFLLWGGSIINELLLNKLWWSIVLFLTILWILFFIITLNYKRVLLAKLNFWYIEWKKLQYFKNEYFNINLFLKYINISILILLWCLIISLFYFILVVILIWFFWWIDWINNIMVINSINSFSIISLILSITYILFITYFLYRVYFSLYIIIDNKKYSALKAIKKSLKKTKENKKIFKFIWIFLLFFVLLFPIKYAGQKLDFNYTKTSYYIELKNKTILKKELTEKENIDYIFLNNKFWNYSWKELVDRYNKIDIMKMIYLIFYFIFIFWIFDLIVAKFYKKEIK